MRYEIIRGLRIDTKNNQVMINSACNNLYPRRFGWEEAKSLSIMLKEHGKKAVEKIFLEHYWGGNFQQGSNIYNKTVQYYSSRLPYSWSTTGEVDQLGKEEFGEKIVHTYEQVAEALWECLQKFRHRDMSKRWAIKHPTNGLFVERKTRNKLYFNDFEFAKIFKSYEDAWLYHSCYEIVEVHA